LKRDQDFVIFCDKWKKHAECVTRGNNHLFIMH